MTAYATREYELAALGDEYELCRRWRSIVHFMVRVSARNFTQVYHRPLRYHELVQLIHYYGTNVCGAPTRSQYLQHCRRLQQTLMTTETVSFAGFDMVQVAD